VMQHLVHVSDPAAVDELLATLPSEQTVVRRRGRRTLIVTHNDDDLETELLFFLKAWALSHPSLEVELDRV
jgi:hypothetical protein